MPDSKFYRSNANTKSQKTVCVFFCEGKSEYNFLEFLKKIIGNDKVEFETYEIPDLGNRRIFKPKYIFDFCMYKTKEQELPDCYKIRPTEIEEQNRIIDLTLEKSSDKYPVIIVDSDVFFYENMQYENIGENANLTALLNKYRENSPEQENTDYIFIEQELCFEDFFVLLVSGQDEYENWFRRRFGYRTPGRPYSATANKPEAEYSPNNLMLHRPANMHLGDFLKQKFNVDILRIPVNPNIEQPYNPRDYKSIAAKEISNKIENYINKKTPNQILRRLKNRIADNEKNGWPFHFGMKDFIEKFIQQN